jgi:hypothetical protein
MPCRMSPTTAGSRPPHNATVAYLRGHGSEYYTPYDTVNVVRARRWCRSARSGEL